MKARAAENKNIENNPMQSRNGPPLAALYCTGPNVMAT